MKKSLFEYLDKIGSSLNTIAKSFEPSKLQYDDLAMAHRWVGAAQSHYLLPVPVVHEMRLEQLCCVETQKKVLLQNTEQLVMGRPANHVLLTGARGCGKSSLVKAMLNQFSPNGLRMIEMPKQYLTDLPVLLDFLRERPEKFIVYCDDLTFQAEDASYQALKTALDGGLTAPAMNVKIYATSNRRHLMPEYFQDNITRLEQGELHLTESIDERVALAERFGLWLTFYPFDQDEYLKACTFALREGGLDLNELSRRAALQWAQMRGARTGRVAYQFAQDWLGKNSQ